MTEDWGETLFSALGKAGGKAFSNMAVGYNNVDVEAANKYGIAVGNTPVISSSFSFRFITVKFHEHPTQNQYTNLDPFNFRCEIQ